LQQTYIVYTPTCGLTLGNRIIWGHAEKCKWCRVFIVHICIQRHKTFIKARNSANVDCCSWVYPALV